VFQAVGLGYGKASDGLMERKPRPPDRPILTRSLLVWLTIAGLVMGAGTLGIIWWGDDNRTVELARTMGLTTFAFANLFFSFASLDERRSLLNLDFLEDRKFLMFSGMSLAAIVLAPELGLFQRILHTVHLSFREWLVCIGIGLLVVVASEIRKWLLRRSDAAAASGAESSAVEGVPVADAA
jgi:Ca2+-transporting ATPase